MDTPGLVAADKAAGKKTIEALDQAGIVVTTAYWGYDEDAGDWHLFMVTPLVAKEGPKAAYSKLQRALLRKAPDEVVPIWRIVVLHPNDRLGNIKHVVRTPRRAIIEVASSSTLSGQVSIGDIFVYRSS